MDDNFVKPSWQQHLNLLTFLLKPTKSFKQWD